MRGSNRSGIMLALTLAFLLLIGRSGAQAQTEVDLALVLAVDISYSMDPDEQELQREGFVEAFRSPLVHDAIRSGMLGRIAVTYMEWAGRERPARDPALDSDRQAETHLAFADRLAAHPVCAGPANVGLGRYRLGGEAVREQWLRPPVR